MCIILVLGLFISVAYSADNATEYIIPGVKGNVKISKNSVEWQGNGECWAYARLIYNKIWGYKFSNSFTSSDNMLRNLTDDQRKINFENTKKFITQAPLGASIRISNARQDKDPSAFAHDGLYHEDGTIIKLYDGKAKTGHNLIVVAKSDKGFTYIENNRAPSKRNEKTVTWEQFVSDRANTYVYFKYIKYPCAQPYNSYSDVKDIVFKNVEYPATFKINTKTGWNLADGIVVSNVELKSIYVRILDSNNKVISSMKSAKPISGRVFAIKALDQGGIDNGQKFSKITSEGKYKWELTAKDKNGHEAKLTLTINAKKTGTTKTAKSGSKQLIIDEQPLSGVYQFKKDDECRKQPEEKAAIAKAQKKGSIIFVVSKVTNAYKNIWYETDKGYYVYSGDVKKVKLTETALSGEYEFIKNDESRQWPYEESKKVKSYSKGSVVKVKAKVGNSYNNVWYKLDTGAYVYSGDVKKHAAATTLRFVDIVYPSTFKINTSQGWFLQGGKVESNVELVSVSTKIVNSSGKIISGEKTRNISGKSYNVKNLDTMETSDNGVKFSKIKSAGDYKWILTAKDKNGRTLKLEMPIKAVSTGSTSTSKKSATYQKTTTSVSLKFIDVVYPSTFKINTSQGWFLQGGKVESNIELASISTKIVNSSGAIISGEKTRSISGKSYNVKNLDTMETSDNGVKFSKIKTAGDYKWILTVKDVEGHSLKLEMPIKVVSTGSTVTSKKSATYDTTGSSNSKTTNKTSVKTDKQSTSATSKIELDGLNYKLNLEKKTATFTGCKDKDAASVTIPSTIEYKGKTYEVTKIAKNACKDMKNLAKVTIGKNVSKIEADAFRGCGKLKSINIKTTKLTADKVEKTAFKGIDKEATVNCPAKSLEEYQKFLIKKGVPKTAKIK